MSWLSRIFGRRDDAPASPAAKPSPPPIPAAAFVAPAEPAVAEPVVAEPVLAEPIAAPRDVPEMVATQPPPLPPSAVEPPPASEPEAPPPASAEEQPDAMTRFMAHQAHMQELHDRAVEARQGQRWNDMALAADALRVDATEANDRQAQLQAYRLLATAHANLRHYPMLFHCSAQAVALARELHDTELPTDEYRLRTFVTALRPHLIASGDADAIAALSAADALIGGI